MFRLLLLCLLGAFAVAGVPLNPGAGAALHPESDKVDPCFDKLPPGCQLAKSNGATRVQVAAISKKLGGAITKISRNTLVVHSRKIDVILIDARTGSDAGRIFKSLGRLKADPVFCLRKGKRVVEFMGSDAALARKASWELGLVAKPRKVHYRIEAEVVPVAEAGYMALTKLLFLFLSGEPGKPGKKNLREIGKTADSIEFGNTLLLREPVLDGKDSGFRFDPRPTAVDGPDPAGNTLFEFGELPDRKGIPYVEVTARIEVDSTGFTESSCENESRLLASTPFWPVDDPEVAALAGKITAGKTTPKGKVDAILAWLAPGKNIKYGGPIGGSRWGVPAVLEKRYGRCWDFADCFVTLCRASGVPCRQVGGWFYGVTAHVWAEVLIPGKGWQQYDATGGGKIDCGIYHIPYFTTEDGEMPSLILSPPRIEILETG